MKIHMIWAQEQDSGIGLKGKLPWHLSEDLKNFKRITKGKPVVMGLNTWISLPVKPLPGRRNIVLSPDPVSAVESYSAIPDCLSALGASDVLDFFVIGGAMVYGQFYPHASDLHITLVDAKTPGVDAWFPIPMEQIEREFRQTEEQPLSDIASYTHWVRRQPGR